MSKKTWTIDFIQANLKQEKTSHSLKGTNGVNFASLNIFLYATIECFVGSLWNFTLMYHCS